MALSVPTVNAQFVMPNYQNSLRAPDGLYIRPYIGVSSYLGDNEKSPFNFNFDAYKVDGKLPFSGGMEVGYQLSPRFSVGGAYQIADYPIIRQQGDLLEPQEDRNTIRHTFQMIFRYTPWGASWRVSPYMQAGANLTTGEVNNDGRWAGGPLVGLGADVSVSKRTSIMLGWNANFTIPDFEIDNNDTNGFGAADMLNAFTAGVKYNLRGTFVPVAISSLDGPETLMPNQYGTFTANINAESASQPTSFEWDFGDGTTSSSLIATHRYENEGTYFVTFTAKNKRSVDTQTLTVTVEEPPVPAAIVAMTATPLQTDTRTPVTFNATVSGDQPLVYTWDFGDGNTSTGIDAVHTYDEPGIYTAKLYISNAVGTDERTVSIMVNPYEADFCAEVVDMNTAFFERNSSILTEAGKTALTANAEILTTCANLTAYVNGYADANERMAEDLAASRAEVVKAYYVDLGVSPSSLITQDDVLGGSTTKTEAADQFRRVDTVPIR